MQPSTREYIEIGLEGGLYGDLPADIEGMFLESGTAKFGRGVLAGTAEDECVIPSATFTAADVMGVTVRSTKKERSYPAGGVVEYGIDDEVPILRVGYIVVIPTTLLTRRGPIFMQHSLHAGNEPGTFRNDNDFDVSAYAIDVSSIFSVFRGNTVLGEPAVLRANIWK